MRISETMMAKVQILETDRSKLPDGVLCRVVYPICNIGQLNANNRVYEREVWEKVLNDKSIREKMASRTLFGQAEHPTETQSDLQLTSHTIFEMWIDEKNGRVYQKMDILDTPTGRIVDTLLRAGCQVGVSTRAEGDLEDYEIGEGKICQRVIPESYRYVTTDFTADPSTFNVAPVALQRNVVPTLKREMKNKEAQPLAKALLESIQKTDESHTSVSVTTDDGTQVSMEAEGNVDVYTSASGNVVVNPTVGVSPVARHQDTPTDLAVEPEGEEAVGEPEFSTMDQLEEPEEEMPESTKAIETTLTEEAWLKLSPADLQKYSTVLEDEAFMKCVKGGGRVRRVSGDKEHGLNPDQYVNYCFKGGKSYRGEVHTKKNESEVNESPLTVQDVKSLFKAIDPAFARHLTGVYSDKRQVALAGSKVGLVLTPEGEALVGKEVAVDRKASNAVGESKIKEGRQVVRMGGDSVGEVVFDTNDDGTFTVTAEGETIATGTWSGGGIIDAKVPDVNQLVNVLSDVMFTHGEVAVEESQIYRDLVDLKVKEASVRAERDALLESFQSDKDAKLQIRILADKLTQIQESSMAEITGLRRVLEKKAQEAGLFKQKLAEALRTRKSEADLNAMFAAHQEELVTAVNEAKAIARADMLREYFDRRLAGSNLQVDENSRALLEGCRNLGDVDSLVDKLIGVARRSALHSRPLNEVTVQSVKPVDPEQRKVDESVSKLMKHLSS